MHAPYALITQRGRNSSCEYFYLLYIQLTISFLIGQKRTANVRNQRLGSQLAADYSIIMSRTLKVMGNCVIYDCSAWFLRVIMSSSHALCCLLSVKKQKHDFQVCFVDRARHQKSSWRQELTNTKMLTMVERSCLLITWKRKNRENLRKRKSWHKLWKQFMSKRERKDSFLPWPLLFWISQKLHPIILFKISLVSTVDVILLWHQDAF